MQCTQHLSHFTNTIAHARLMPVAIKNLRTMLGSAEAIKLSYFGRRPRQVEGEAYKRTRAKNLPAPEQKGRRTEQRWWRGKFNLFRRQMDLEQQEKKGLVYSHCISSLP